MEEKKMQEQIDLLNQKMDIILEELMLQKAQRVGMDDLKDDLMRVGTDVYHTVVQELDNVVEQVNGDDLLHLVKTLYRNVNNISKTVGLLESSMEFVNDVSPIAREVILNGVTKLDELDRKGYFEFAAEATKIIDNVVSSFTKQDVKDLADNIVTILTTIKGLTQPDMLMALNNAVNVYKKLDIEVEEKVSIFSLFKKLNSPEMRRGLAFGVKFLEALAKDANYKK